MKTIKLFFAIAFLASVLSCQNETSNTESNAEEKNVEVNASKEVKEDVKEVDNSAENGAVVEDNIVSEKENEKTKPDEVVAETKVEKKVEKSSADVKKANIDEANNTDKEKVKEEIKTAEDLSGELNNKVNRQANPDNYNGVAEPESESDVNVVPVYTDDQLDNYFVQVLIKVHKLSKSELMNTFNSKEKVYVVQNEGLYKYCLGNFEDEADANAYKKEIDKKYKFEDTQVVTFKQAW
jgi:hypothetical protein